MKDRCFMMQSKQRIFMIFIAVMLLSCFLTGCYIGAEQVPTEEMTQPEETTQATEPTETEPPAPVEMTYEEFVEKTTGCWFDASTIRSDSQDYHYLLVASLKENNALISYWPGEMTGSYFNYDRIEWWGGNEYVLYTTTPPVNFEGVMYPGTTGSMVVTFYDDGTLGIEQEGATYHFTYGGATPKEAAETAKAMSN